MRKLFAISLLAVHLFNLTGYSLLFQHFINQSDKEVSKKADDKLYDSNELVEVKIPLNLPYFNDWSGYERVDGEIEMDGVHYNYVQRKVSKDTLYILCLPNQIKTKLVNGKTEYGIAANDLPSKQKDTESAGKKTGIFSEYNFTVAYSVSVFSIPTSTQYGNFIAPGANCLFADVCGQPPESLA